MIPKIVYYLISSKEKLLLASLLGLGGASVYYGTIQPSYKNQVAKIVGSEDLRDKGKEPFLNEEIYSAFYINSNQKELNKNIPSFSNYLKKEHLEKGSKEKYKSLFSPEMREHIRDDEQEQKFSWGANGVGQSAIHLLHYDYDAIMLDDRDVTDKSVKHISQLQKIQKSQFIQDIIWSLAEESEFNKTLIRPDSISITAELDPPEKYVSDKDNIETDSFPAPTAKINNLNISLKVFNPNKTQKSLFKQISLNPFSESVVNISLEKGDIKLVTKNTGIVGLKSSSWAINPIRNHIFKVKINQIYPLETSSEDQLETLDLLFSNSKYIGDAISLDTQPFLGRGVPSLPLITYKDMQDATTSLLIKITPEQIKKDIEHWYGAYYIHWWRLRLLDIKNFFSILQKNIFLTNTGKQVSILDKAIDDVAFRNNYYTHLHLNNDYRKILDLLFKKGGADLKAPEIKALLNAWSYQIDQIIDKIKVKIKWEKEPTLSYGSMEDNSPFKTVSFKFSQEVSWEDDIVIPFKGAYDFKEKKFEESAEENSDSSSNKVKFDFSSKLSQIQAFLAPLQGTLINITKIGEIDIFNKLIPNIGSFIGWDKFEIKKNEKITTIYNAVNSSIRPAADNKLDTYDQSTKKVNLGWKALDVEVTKDLSNFHNVFYTLYEKIDLHKEEGGALKLTELASIYDKFKDKPISMVAHIINSTWDKNYGKRTKEDEKKDHERHSLNLFLKSL